ncbi:573_t:CDS:1, partial [Rhizophagus irregularis]
MNCKPGIVVNRCGKDLDPTITFHMKRGNIYVNNFFYNDDNVINANINQFVSMDIEVFLVSDGQYETAREFRRSGNIRTSSWG